MPFPRPTRFRPSSSRTSGPIALRRALAAALALGVLAASSVSARADGDDVASEAPPPVASEAPQGPKETEPTESAPPAPPRVTLGKPRTVRGGVPPKGVESALHAIAPAIEACYRASVDAGRDADGSLELRMELVGPGKVAAVAVNTSRGVSSMLRGCVRDAFAGVAAGGVGPEPVEVLMAIDFDREAPLDFSLPASACPSSCDGDLDDELKSELRARALEASKCFKRAASPGESLTMKAGELQVTVRVASDGSVCGVTTGGDPFRPSLTSCVVDTLSRAYAAAPAGCLDVTVPLAFKGT